MNKELLSTELKRQLKVKGISARKLSTEIGKSPTYINQLINDRIQKLDYVDAHNIFTKLGLIIRCYMDSYLNLLGIIMPENITSNVKLKDIDECYKMSFNEYIKNYITRNNIDVSELEEREGYENNYIYNLLSNNDTINYKKAYTILTVLNINIPMNQIIDFLVDVNIKPPAIIGIPGESVFLDSNNNKYVPEGFKNYKDFNHYLKNDFDPEEEEKTRIEEQEYNYNRVLEANKKAELYPLHKKQELLDKLDEVNDKLKKIVNHFIDPDKYVEKHKYEECITTLTKLVLDDTGIKMFLELMKLPLQELEPKDIKEIVEFIDSKLEYKYVFHVPDDSNKQANSIDDLLMDYPHLKCTSKESYWE